MERLQPQRTTLGGGTKDRTSGSIKGRSHSLTPTMPTVCITPMPEEGREDCDTDSKGVEPAQEIPGQVENKKLTTRPRPRLSIPHIFAHQPSGTSPLTSTPSISSLFTAAAARNFSFHIPSSMRRGSWSVSLSSNHHSMDPPNRSTYSN